MAYISEATVELVWCCSLLLLLHAIPETLFGTVWESDTVQLSSSIVDREATTGADLDFLCELAPPPRPALALPPLPLIQMWENTVSHSFNSHRECRMHHSHLFLGPLDDRGLIPYNFFSLP